MTGRLRRAGRAAAREIQWERVHLTRGDWRGYVGGICAFAIFALKGRVSLCSYLPGPSGARRSETGFRDAQAAKERAGEILAKFLAEFPARRVDEPCRCRSAHMSRPGSPVAMQASGRGSINRPRPTAAVVPIAGRGPAQPAPPRRFVFPRERTGMYQWEPHVPRSPRLRVEETSCCGEYELAAEGGQYVVLRPAGSGHQETARGTYARAARAYADLAGQHVCRSQAS